MSLHNSSGYEQIITMVTYLDILTFLSSIVSSGGHFVEYNSNFCKKTDKQYKQTKLYSPMINNIYFL